MIVIPAGPPENEPDRLTSEGPQHEVTLAQPFAVSKFEVTFEEWDACVTATGARE
jgi:formylglycine-generating enzyme required for sulfatase activity